MKIVLGVSLSCKVLTTFFFNFTIGRGLPFIYPWGAITTLPLIVIIHGISLNFKSDRCAYARLYFAL